MRKLLALLALTLSLSAQTTTISLTGPASVTAGNSFTLTLSAAGTGTQGIVALQWSLPLPSGFTLGAPVLASSDPTGDVGVCGTAACLIYGSLTSIADGTLATLPVTVPVSAAPGNQTLNISGLFAATKDGFNVNGLTAGSAYTIKVLSPCDLNGDGAITIADVQLIVGALVSGGACPITAANGGCSVLTVVEEIVAVSGGSCKICCHRAAPRNSEGMPSIDVRLRLERDFHGSNYTMGGMNLKANATFKAGSFSRLEALLVPKLIAGAQNGADAVLEISQVLVPVDTGELKASGGTSVEWTGHKVTGYIVYSAPWAAYNEFGTGRRGEASGHGAPGISYDSNWPGMPGSPYIRPALDIGRSQVLTAFQEALGV